ncbi:hypothetical protein GQ44DRAFT_766334 [Phaeosphaeriaceae sp. PMI808]|nr:hypothetical protein GQ44DRAFT_766334 [Phaeosphaeriaceae sp. PMI808]
MSSKRRREVESDSEDGEEYGYGYGSRCERQQIKKSRTWFNNPHTQDPSPQNLPIRPSPTPPRRVSDIESMTPAQSDYEGDSPNPAYGGPVQCSEPVDNDMEMEDDNFDITSQPSQSPSLSSNFLRPAMLNASLFSTDSITTNSRIPTPIHPTFKRGGINGLGFPTSGSAGHINTSSNTNIPTIQAPSSRKSTGANVSDDRSRRMPSPISEDEDIPDTPTAITQSQLSRLSFSQDNMDTEDPPAVSSSPAPRGRKRSGAFTGMARFSMGYRDDCEKCRQRVPGHYSHFLS